MLKKHWPIYVLLKIGIALAQCYFPGGNLAPNHHPCYPYAFTSLCCESGWTCFDNGLCAITSSNSSNSNSSSVGSAARGTCTNPLWNDTACGNFCLDDPVNDNDGSVISCGNQNWCCQPGAAAGTCNCASGDGTFSLQNGLAQTIIGIQGLEKTNTNVIPISSASIPPITASNPAITTSSFPSQTDAAQDESRTSTSLGYSASLSAPAASSITSSSSSLPSSQSISTMTLQPTIIITTMPPSGVSTASGSSSPTASKDSSTSAAHSTAFIAGVSAGSAISAAAIMGILFWLFLHKRRRQARRGDFIHHEVSNPTSAGQRGPLVTEDAAQDIDYRTRWPLQRSPPEALTNRSGHELHPLVPDHDSDRPVQPNLYGPPASDPYAVPPVDPDIRREASRLQGGPGSASPLNYRPTMRGSNRSRGHAYRTMPRAPQAWRPEVPGMTQDWPTGEQT